MKDTLAMGSVRMDKGEGVEYLEGQMERMAKQGPEHYFFDIICEPGQIEDAVKLLGRFYELVADVMPLEHVHAGVTCQNMIRPATMALVMLTQHGEVAVKDINSERQN